VLAKVLDRLADVCANIKENRGAGRHKMGHVFERISAAETLSTPELVPETGERVFYDCFMKLHV
jgi:hypothetical protein